MTLYHVTNPLFDFMQVRARNRAGYGQYSVSSSVGKSLGTFCVRGEVGDGGQCEGWWSLYSSQMKFLRSSPPSNDAFCG